MTLGELLLHFMKQKGILQQDLARESGIPLSSINRMLRGKLDFDQKLLNLLKDKYQPNTEQC